VNVRQMGGTIEANSAFQTETFPDNSIADKMGREGFIDKLYTKF
jgi:hypothetical protein